MRRIGILQAGPVVPHIAAEHGDYPDMFATLLGRTDTEFVTWNAQRGEFPSSAKDADAFVITGSRCSVFDADDWIEGLARCVNKLIDTGACVVGVCFGHQLIAHFRGGATAPASVGWGVGVHSANVIESAATWRKSLVSSSYSLLASHRDQVTSMPEGGRLWATSDFCPISAYTIDASVLCIQQHAEFTKAYARALMHLRAELIGPDLLAAGLASLDQQTNGQAVAGWIHDFIDRAC